MWFEVLNKDGCPAVLLCNFWVQKVLAEVDWIGGGKPEGERKLGKENVDELVFSLQKVESTLFCKNKRQLFLYISLREASPKAVPASEVLMRQ